MMGRGWFSGGQPFAEGSRLPARALGLLFVAGATIGLVSLLLPMPPGADTDGLWSNVALAYVGGAAMLASVGRVRTWMLHVALATGSLLITRAVYLSGDPASFYSVWFIWVGLYAFYFFNRGAAVCHIAFVAALYGATLINDPPSSPIGRWLTTVATLIVAGAFIDALVGRARRQASTASATAESLARVAGLAHELAGMTDSGMARLALCEGAVRVTKAGRGVLWEPSEDGIRVSASAGGLDCIAPYTEAPAGAREAFATGNPVTVCERPEDGACLWQPIVHERRTVGVLELIWDAPETDSATGAVVSLLAVEIAVTLQRVALLAELEAIARTDELTALPNRRAWQEQLARELARAQRSEHPFCVAMLDLDHFKRYNDTRGHQTGDWLLKQVASAWSAELRPTDVLARYGGEEFALALPDCPLEEAVAVVERLRAAMPDAQTCSAGIACWDGGEAAVDLLARADHALYRAKRGGRDRTAVAGPAGPVFPLEPAGPVVSHELAGPVVSHGSAGPVVSHGSAGPVVSHGSAGPVVSHGSAGPVVSHGSAGPVVSHGSAGPVVSHGSAGPLVELPALPMAQQS
jgi:diguanylate cyclase (GGDEF)-like protein